jgi:UDP-glucose 4-epimerase
MVRGLVTGGTGFIAAHTFGKLLEVSHAVLVADNLSCSSVGSLPFGVEFHQVGVGTRVFEALVAEKKPDFVGLQATQISENASVFYFPLTDLASFQLTRGSGGRCYLY